MPYVPATPTVRRYLRQERRWVSAGCAVLAGVAGYVNAVLLGYFHVPVSHMSGAVSRLSSDLATVNMTDLVLVLGIFAGFLLGAMLSGVIIGGTRLVPGRRYGVTLLVEGLLLALAMLLLLQERTMGVPLAAMACGMQNAMASSYFGLVLRTTHVTGVVTDLGVLLGHWLRHRRIRRWKLILLSSILGGFFSGGVLGALIYSRIGMLALTVASGGCVAAGIGYFIWQHRHERSASNRALEERLRGLR